MTLQQRDPILILDDDPVYLQVLESACALFGYKTVVAQTIDEAKEAVKESTVSAIIADRFVGTDDVFQFIELLRSTQIEMPDVIFISGFWDEQSSARAKELKAKIVLHKPFSLTELRQSIELSPIS